MTCPRRGVSCLLPPENLSTTEGARGCGVSQHLQRHGVPRCLSEDGRRAGGRARVPRPQHRPLLSPLVQQSSMPGASVPNQAGSSVSPLRAPQSTAAGWGSEPCDILHSLRLLLPQGIGVGQQRQPAL